MYTQNMYIRKLFLQKSSIPRILSSIISFNSVTEKLRDDLKNTDTPPLPHLMLPYKSKLLSHDVILL